MLPPDSAAIDSAPVPAESPSATAPSLHRLIPWAVTTAMLASVFAWYVGESKLVRVRPRAVPMVTMGIQHLGTTAATIRAATVATAARANAVLGAALGLALAAAGSVAGRSFRSALPAILAGVSAGALAGFGVSYAVAPLFVRYYEEITSDLLVPIAFHGMIWGAVGASAAFALGIGAGAPRRRIARVVIGGVVAALLGTAAFQLLGALLLANDETAELVAGTARARLVAPLIVTTYTAVGAAFGFHERRAR